jgi:hypothetical protein
MSLGHSSPSSNESTVPDQHEEGEGDAERHEDDVEAEREGHLLSGRKQLRRVRGEHGARSVQRNRHQAPQRKADHDASLRTAVPQAGTPAELLVCTSS